jgi:hypothetical protein
VTTSFQKLSAVRHADSLASASAAVKCRAVDLVDTVKPSLRVGYDVLTAVVIKGSVFSDIMLCSSSRLKNKPIKKLA